MKKDNHGQLKIIQMNYREDRPRAKNPIKIQDVTFRDGHQSIFATRGRIVCRPGDILKPEFEEAKQKIKHITSNIDDILIYALFPLTGERFLKWKFGLEGIPDEVRPITLEHVKKEKKLVEKALSGDLIEKPHKDIPPKKPDNLRNFDLYVDDEYFNIEIGEE